MQHQLTTGGSPTPSPLLDECGCLAQVGWARQPLLDCNLENVHFYRLHPLQRFRIKRWDYYGLTTPGETIEINDVMGFAEEHQARW